MAKTLVFTEANSSCAFSGYPAGPPGRYCGRAPASTMPHCLDRASPKRPAPHGHVVQAHRVSGTLAALSATVSAMRAACPNPLRQTMMIERRFRLMSGTSSSPWYAIVSNDGIRRPRDSGKPPTAAGPGPPCAAIPRSMLPILWRSAGCIPVKLPLAPTGGSARLAPGLECCHARTSPGPGLRPRLRHPRLWRGPRPALFSQRPLAGDGGEGHAAPDRARLPRAPGRGPQRRRL